MPLTHNDLRRLARGELVDIPAELFQAPSPREWPEDIELRRAVEWFKGYVGDDWPRRRIAAFSRLHALALGDVGPSGDGRFFDSGDAFGWYLFLAEAALDHAWNYEPMFGSRVVPLFKAIGRELSQLQSVPGVDNRIKRLVNAERRQPNGGIFELLVAAAYCRAGGTVTFIPEQPGCSQTCDMDVLIDGIIYAVECKWMETSEYGNRERMQMQKLWEPAVRLGEKSGHSIFSDITFSVPVFDVPSGYLVEKLSDWLASRQTTFLWEDEIGHGTITTLDMLPLKQALQRSEILVAGTRLLQLLTGEYKRHENYIQALRMKTGVSPRYLSECEQAILLRWKSLSPVSIKAKARDVLKKLSSANKQLPMDRPGIIHTGLEAVEGDETEEARVKRIVASIGRFDPKGKPLAFVHCHHFMPESPPDDAWNFEERADWKRIAGSGKPPLQPGTLVTLSDKT